MKKVLLGVLFTGAFSINLNSEESVDLIKEMEDTLQRERAIEARDARDRELKREKKLLSDELLKRVFYVRTKYLKNAGIDIGEVDITEIFPTGEDHTRDSDMCVDRDSYMYLNTEDLCIYLNSVGSIVRDNLLWQGEATKTQLIAIRFMVNKYSDLADKLQIAMGLGDMNSSLLGLLEDLPKKYINPINNSEYRDVERAPYGWEDSPFCSKISYYVEKIDSLQPLNYDPYIVCIKTSGVVDCQLLMRKKKFEEKFIQYLKENNEGNLAKKAEEVHEKKMKLNKKYN